MELPYSLLALAAVLELGALVGCLAAGTLSERLSRTLAICIACGESGRLD